MAKPAPAFVLKDAADKEVKLTDFKGKALIANPSSHELNIAADGSTMAPEFLASSIPKVHGVVQGQDGRPVSNAVVRFRGSMLTGRYPHHCVPGHEYPLPDGQPTLTEPLKSAGYQTAYFGKWHLAGFHERAPQ